MQALKDYLAAAGLSADEFARAIAVEPEDFRRMLSGADAPAHRIAQRIADMTDGAVTTEDLTPGAAQVVDLNARAAASSPEIDQEALTRVLAEILPALVGGAQRKGDEHLPRIAADAVASAYAALSSITTRRNTDRLVQALLPVFAEILAETPAPPSRRAQAAPLAREAAERYLRTAPPRR
jgi:DNA-binding transcriptional regulator YdaS (Cro superfamily)